MPDLETLTVAMLVVLNATENKNFKPSKLSIKSYREEIMGSDTKGVNAMSISDITGIPRATVIRKLNKLLKEKFLTIDSKKHYSAGGYHAKNILDVQKNTLNNLSKLTERIYNLSLMKDN